MNISLNVSTLVDKTDLIFYCFKRKAFIHREIYLIVYVIFYHEKSLAVTHEFINLKTEPHSFLHEMNISRTNVTVHIMDNVKHSFNVILLKVFV